MNQPVLQNPQVQEAWLPVLSGGHVTLPEGWFHELGMKAHTLVKAQKDGNRVIIETQAEDILPSQELKEPVSLPTAEPKTAHRQLAEFYRFENPEAIWPFLKARPHLIPVLIEAHDQIRKYFPSADLVLVHVPDPEIPNYEQLMLHISRGPDGEKDFAVLRQFTHEWWLNARKKVRGELCITVGKP